MAPLSISWLPLLALATGLATLSGGFLFLRYQKSQHTWFAFAAASLITVSLLDLLPESLELGGSQGLAPRSLLLALVASFFVYSFIDRFFLTHHHHDQDEEHGHPMGLIGAGSLVVHSFLDGVAIGIAFQVSASVGAIVATAVLAHDMMDGMNTVAIMLRHGQSAARARGLLLLDAAAPLAGILLAGSLALPQAWLAWLLAVFAGEFLYLGAGSLLPEAQGYPSANVMGAMAAGAGLVVALTWLL